MFDTKYDFDYPFKTDSPKCKGHNNTEWILPLLIYACNGH
jgi:hypothetical protein